MKSSRLSRHLARATLAIRPGRRFPTQSELVAPVADEPTHAAGFTRAEQIEPLELQVSRRLVVGAGARLAYAAPLVVATVSLSPTFGYERAVAYFEKKRKKKRAKKHKTGSNKDLDTDTQAQPEPADDVTAAAKPRKGKGKKKSNRPKGGNGKRKGGKKGNRAKGSSGNSKGNRGKSSHKNNRGKKNGNSAKVGGEQGSISAPEDQLENGQPRIDQTGDAQDKTADGTADDGAPGNDTQTGGDPDGSSSPNGASAGGRDDNHGGGQDGEDPPKDGEDPAQDGEDSAQNAPEDASQGASGSDDGPNGRGNGAGDSQPGDSANEGHPEEEKAPGAGDAPVEKTRGGREPDPPPPTPDDSVYLPANGGGNANDVPTHPGDADSETANPVDDPNAVSKVSICHAVCTKKDRHSPRAYTLIEIDDDPDAWDLHVLQDHSQGMCTKDEDIILGPANRGYTVKDCPGNRMSGP